MQFSLPDILCFIIAPGLGEFVAGCPNLQETLGWDEVYNGTEWNPGAKDWKNKNIRYIDPQFAGHNFLDFTIN